MYVCWMVLTIMLLIYFTFLLMQLSEQFIPYIEAGLETLSLLQDELALPVTVPLVSCMNNYSDYG